MADVVKYSSLMGEDEAATLRTLTTYQGIMDGLIRQHRGRVVESPEDAVLAEFSSVVDAVQCAVAVQKELQARNAELLEDSRMQFRIGINTWSLVISFHEVSTKMARRVFLPMPVMRPMRTLSALEYWDGVKFT